MSTNDETSVGTATTATATAAEMRTHRREQVRRRVETVLAMPLHEVGPDYVLPDGRVVAIYYSKIHPDGNAFLGVKNRIRNDDIIVLLLGDEKNSTHLVFPRAEELLRYKKYFTAVGGDRVTPPISISDGTLSLLRPTQGLDISLDDRVDAYYELLHPPKEEEKKSTSIGKSFTADDETASPRAASAGMADPNLVGRGVRAHKRVRNALADHLESIGLIPLDPAPSDPPFDLAWWRKDFLYVAEIKSVTRENEEHQLRLGLGQLLRYASLLSIRAEHVVPVLVPEINPRDPEWYRLCQSLNVKIIFPPKFEFAS